MLKQNSTVRRWLVTLVAGAVFPTLIAALAALFYAYQEEQSGFRQGLTETTRALALVVDREIARREAIALTLAGSPTLTRGDLQAFHEYASQIAPTRDKVVVLQDLAGKQLVNTRLPLGAPLPESRNSAERQAAGPLSTVVSDVYFAPVGQQYSFAVQVPVVRDGNVRYFLSVAGYASALQTIMVDQKVPEGWIASILDAKGVVVVRNNAPEQFVGKPTSARLAAQMAQRSEGVFESSTIDGIPILATFSKSPSYGWSVVVGVPLGSISTPLKHVGVFAAFGALLLLASLVLAISIGRRLINPVERLRLASLALGSGEPIDLTPTGLRETDQVLAALIEAKAASEKRRLEIETAAAQIRRSNERVKLATDASGLGLFTWDPVLDTVTWHNDRPYEIFGIEPGSPPVNARRFFEEYVHRDDAPAFAHCVQEALRGDSPFYFQGRIHRSPDREVRWVEFTGQAEKSDLDAVVRIVGTAADVTPRKLAEHALRQSEERLRELANTIPNLAWMANADGWITWYNDRWYDYTGTTPAEMEGWGWQKVHDPQALPGVLRQWEESIRTGQPFEMTFPLLGKDGAYRPFFTRIAPLRGATGNIVHWFGTNTDVSPLKKAEEELRAADRRKDEFLAMLAHELRNPLAPIRTSAELLRRAGIADPTVAKVGAVIARQVTHMSGLLNDLLDVSRITRGLIAIDMEVIDLAAVITGAVEQARPLMEARRHNLAVEGMRESSGIHVLASPLRLTQVIANLLDNAAKYSDPQARITIHVRPSGANVTVAITDTGVGIAADLLPHVFEPFTQAARGSDRSQGGLGLGLTVVKGLIELQHGTVHAHSAGLGKGSTFTISLPVARVDAAPARPRDNARTGAPSPALHVLVVDDNADAADTLCALLHATGHRSQCAYTAQQALELVDEHAFDAAILDIGLPDMSGYQLAAMIKGQAGASPLLIALSGYGQSQDRAASLAAGFARHLVKPVDPGVLLDALAASPLPEGFSS